MLLLATTFASSSGELDELDDELDDELAGGVGAFDFLLPFASTSRSAVSVNLA